MFILFALFLSLSIAVLPVRASEPSLAEILGNVGFANIVNSTATTFPSGHYKIALYAELTQYFDLNELCFYQVGTNNSMPILEGSEGGDGYISPLTKTFEADSEFGLSLSRNDSLPFTYYTEPARNVGSQQFAVVYNNLDSPGMFLIGFDDRSYCTGLGDYDCNDMVFSLQQQYYLTVQTIPLGLADIPGQGWYDQYQDVTLTAASILGYNFSYWDVDSTPRANGLVTIAVNMNASHTASAHYTKTLTLTIAAESGGSTNPPPGTYVADENSTFQVTATPNANYVLDHWELDGTSVGSENPYSVLMNANHTIRAIFVYSPPPPQFLVTIDPMSALIDKGQSVKFNSTVSGGTPPYDYQWYLDNNPVLGGTSDSWIATFALSGIHYVDLKVTDSDSNSAQSNIARINVASPSVGGYSIAGSGSEGGESLMLDLTVLVALAAGATIINRKRKRFLK